MYKGQPSHHPPSRSDANLRFRSVPSRLSIEKWGAVLDGVQSGSEIVPHAEAKFIKSV